jgi:predicted dehydrogenase
MSLPQAAIAGLGMMGRTHLQSLRRLGVTVRGVIGISPEEGQRFAETYGVERVYASFEELVSDPRVDVVHVCTPNYLHYPMARAALEHSKHVICEKPLALTAKESVELVRSARSKGLAAVVNFNLRFYPLCLEARARVRSGELGEVRLIQGGYVQDWLTFPTDWNWRLEARQGGAMRAVADVGSHWMDMITWITGLEVAEVLADSVTFIPTRYKPRVEVETFQTKLLQPEDVETVKINTEDCANVLLIFEGGARASMTVSQISPGRKNQLWWEINGSKASLRWEQENPNQLWFGYREQPNAVLVKDPSLMQASERPFASYPGGHAEGYPDTFFQLFQTVYSALRDGTPLDAERVPKFSDGHREMILCDAIQESARKRKWIKVKYYE